MSDGRRELTMLRMRLALTYWIVVILSVIMFALGIILLSVPAIMALQGRTAELQALVAAGFGVACLRGTCAVRHNDLNVDNHFA